MPSPHTPSALEFSSAFRALEAKHRPPLRWQARLYERFRAGDIPRLCRIPTGMGKTSIIPIWLIAAAASPAGLLPRRLLYVVNRRTVVDQATDDARRMLDRLRWSAQREGLAWANGPASTAAARTPSVGGEASAIPDEHGPVLAALRSGLSRLSGDDDSPPLVISTLRGELADNGEWKQNPARPAIIAGTIDMIGSKLLFSGYGDGRYGRAHHAGLVGQDSLIVHDEAHLSPAFELLLKGVASEQERCREARPIRVMNLSATARNPCATNPDHTFALSPEDASDALVQQRLRARKILRIHEPGSGEKKDGLVKSISERALEHRASACRVLIYVRSPEHAKAIRDAIAARLREEAKSVGTPLTDETLAERLRLLTGTIRGFERDALAESRLFKAFSSNADPSVRGPHALFLVSTSAGEVGADLDADHLVCDLTTLENVAQRLGRVNRIGGVERLAEVDIFLHNIEDKEPLAEQMRETARLLRELPRADPASVHPGFDASPAALSTLLSAPEASRGFTPAPQIPPATDILFDAWSLTSIGSVRAPDGSVRDALAGRPDVEPYLHGESPWEPPETHVAWRADVKLLAEAKLSDDDLARVLEVFPLRSSEQLRDRTDRVFKQLESVAERLQAQTAEPTASAEDALEDTRSPRSNRDPYVILIRRRSAELVLLSKLLASDTGRSGSSNEAQRRLAYATVILPVEAGGLSGGMLDGKAPRDAETRDVSEKTYPGQRQRQRVLVSGDGSKEPLLEFPEIPGCPCCMDISLPETTVEAEESLPQRLEYRVEKGEAAHRGTRVALAVHNREVARCAVRFAEALGLPERHQRALELAGQLHDLGKDRDCWQEYARNLPHRREPGGPIAKSDRFRHWTWLNGYRHEFGSLRDARADVSVTSLDQETRDLALHLIATHHGCGRPHFEHDPGAATGRSSFDFEGRRDLADRGAGRPSLEDNQAIAIETMDRFARLQTQYGRWGLAWLESILRCADGAASDASESVRVLQDSAALKLISAHHPEHVK